MTCILSGTQTLNLRAVFLIMSKPIPFCHDTYQHAAATFKSPSAVCYLRHAGFAVLFFLADMYNILVAVGFLRRFMTH